MSYIMTNKEKQQLLQDEWPQKYPKGEKALLQGIKQASKAKIFDLEEDKETLLTSR